MEKNNIFPESTERANSTLSADKNKRVSSYNYTDMQKDTIAVKNYFATRLAYLRNRKGISAREMSLSLGEGPGYISNIENDYSKPSLEMFFEICEYLEVSPAEFFDYAIKDPMHEKEIIAMLNKLDESDYELVKTLITKLAQRR